MKIAIDFRNTYKTDPALRVFTMEYWQELAALKPASTFIFITDEPHANAPAAGNLLWQQLATSGFRWLDQKRRQQKLATWQTDRLITLQPAGFTIHQAGKKKQGPANTVQPVLFAGNGVAQPKNEAGTVFIHPALAAVAAPLSWAEAESIKTQYTGGRSFFLFTGNIGEAQLLDLLKAFSVFKKWQQSNMQLVIAGYATASTPMLEEKLATYKYRADVVLLKNPATATIEKLVSACYAMTYPAAGNAFPLALLWAVQLNKAMIATDNTLNRQLVPAAEWVLPDNTAAGFAKAMILLYKDEAHQQSLVRAAMEQSGQYSRAAMLAQVWTCIEK